MRNSMIFISLLTFALCSGGSLVRGQTLYSNLGPLSSAYNPSHGWSVCGSAAPNCELFSTAMQFTPATGGTVTQIDLAVSYVVNQPFNVSIWTDVNGLPGAQVPNADWNGLTASTKSNTCCGLVTISGILGVSLESGVSYFLILNSTNINGTAYLTFNDNNQGATGLELYSINGGTTWNSNGTQTIGAFDILSEPAYAQYFPQIAIGGSWSTAVTIVNYGPVPLTLNFNVYNGGPLPVDMSVNGVSSCQSCSALEGIIIPSMGTANIGISTTNSNTLVGWAVATGSTENFSGVADYMYVPQTTLQTMVGVLPCPTENVFMLPVHDNVPDNIMTGYAIANVTDSAITVNIAEVNQNGEVVANLTPITLGPYGHVSQFLFQDPAASQTLQGSAVFTGANQATFSVVGLVSYQGIYSALPSIF